jgi:hypothetical protein
MTGLIRIPGAPASNFDTGDGKTVVDLINAGDEAGGYAAITAVELLFTQAAPGQPFLVADRIREVNARGARLHLCNGRASETFRSPPISNLNRPSPRTSVPASETIH